MVEGKRDPIGLGSNRTVALDNESRRSMTVSELERRLGPETSRGHQRRLGEGFYRQYLSGDAVLDIGYRGGRHDAVPVTEKAIGIELDFPGYDGIHLPFSDATQDAVFASHTLEHIEDWRSVLVEWFRVLKVRGFLIIAVPHQQLYERKAYLPSRFNGDHKRFYTPRSLLQELETALPVGCWRLRSLRDIDDGFLYGQPPELHPRGGYEIELVLQKIEPPFYAAQLTPSPHSLEVIKFFATVLALNLEARASGQSEQRDETEALLASLPLPGFTELRKQLPANVGLADLKEVLRALIDKLPFNDAAYLERYPDVRKAVEDGLVVSGYAHYKHHGYFTGRIGEPSPGIFR